MAGINQVILCGRLTAVPELKQSSGGVSVTTFTIAVDRRKGDPCDFIEVVAWRDRAEFLCKFFGKGDPVLIRGAIQKRNWQDKQGNNRSVVEVVADEIEFVPGIPKPSEKPDNYNPYTAPAKMEEIPNDEDLPF